MHAQAQTHTYVVDGCCVCVGVEHLHLLLCLFILCFYYNIFWFCGWWVSLCSIVFVEALFLLWEYSVLVCFIQVTFLFATCWLPLAFMPIAYQLYLYCVPAYPPPANPPPYRPTNKSSFSPSLPPSMNYQVTRHSLLAYTFALCLVSFYLNPLPRALLLLPKHRLLKTIAGYPWCLCRSSCPPSFSEVINTTLLIKVFFIVLCHLFFSLATKPLLHFL